MFKVDREKLELFNLYLDIIVKVVEIIGLVAAAVIWLIKYN